MSTPDTSLFFKFPQIDRQQQDLAIAQKQALIAEQKARTEDQLAQAQYLTREGDKLRHQNAVTRLIYNVKHSVDDLVQQNPNTTRQDHMRAGGDYALPYIKAR